MTKRVPKNHVKHILNEEQKKLLDKIVMLNETKPYPPTMMDLINGDRYSTVLNRLYKLEKTEWVRVDRDARGRIRAIVPLMKP